MPELSALIERLSVGAGREDDLLVVRRGCVGTNRQRLAAARSLETYALAVRAGKAPLYSVDVADEIVDAWLRNAPASAILIAALKALQEREGEGSN